MKNQSTKSAADEFEIGKPANKTEAATLPATAAEKPKLQLPKPAPPSPKIPKDIGGGSPALHDGKPVAFTEKLPDDLGTLLKLMTELDNEQPIKGNRAAELKRRAKLDAVKKKVSALQQGPTAPVITANTLQIGMSPKRRREMAEKLLAR